jgi:hypothetical protein
MRKLLYLCLPITLLLFGTCKKVTKQVNSEKMFSLIFVDSLNTPINQCYDRVWAEGKANLANCSNSTDGLQLPLSIKSDSTSTFFLKKNNKIDTLIVVYHKTIAPQTSEFEVFYDLTQIKGSFKKWSIKCIPDLTPKCDGNKAQLSAVIFQ